MSIVLRPRRGTKSKAIENNIVLARGEVFFECPDSGVGTGTGKVKVGDGTTPYSSLPYFLDTTTPDSTHLHDEMGTTEIISEDLDIIKPENVQFYFALARNGVVHNPAGDGVAFGMYAYKNGFAQTVQELIDQNGIKYVRYWNSSSWSNWKTFAYTDSNVASASKVNGHTVESDVPENASFTDINVRQQLNEDNNNFPLLMSYGSNQSEEVNVDNVVSRNNSIYANPSTGMTASTSHKINEAVTLQYDSNIEALNFVFS